MKISSLYDGETVRKKFEKVKISTSQRDAANVWLEKLESGELKDEVKNYEVFRETILRDLLGYPDSKLHFEEKDVEFSYTDNRDVTHVCIECKGTKTKDLFARQPYEKREQETPVLQTWSNMGRFNPAALYGICTNYQNFVLLDQKYGSSKCHKFDFMEIRDSDEKLREFVGLFSYKELVLEKTLEGLYKVSSTRETDFTKEFYKLFHETRLMLIEAFKEKFAKDDTSSAIKYAQMYLNRLIFLFFAEDRGDVEDRLFTKRVVKILEAGNINSQSRSISEDIVTLFKQLDKGERARPPFEEIFAFNGGLFKEDIPPNAFFRDLRDEEFFSGVRKNFKFTKKLELDEPTRRAVKPYEGELSPIVTNLLLMDRFDFMKDIGVNIMGHILEQSISDLEELQGDKATKRKKDGVYYTPEYITEYICNNTIIPYLSETDSNTIEDLISEYDGRLVDLEDKMHSLRILDPACGSGAFLIKAAETLLKIDEAIQKERPSPLAQKGLGEYQEEAKIVKIIEDCIFGVDINEEAVEIAKLSMFLRIAGPNRKLVDLSNNILVGNSLVDDEIVDPKNAFCWEKEFSEKFDIVIGNPPYKNVQELSDKTKKHLEENNTEIYNGQNDLHYYFISKGLALLKDDGVLCEIVSRYFFEAYHATLLRSKILKDSLVKKIIDFYTLRNFEDADTLTTIIKLQKKPLDEKLNQNSISVLRVVPNPKWKTKDHREISEQILKNSIHYKNNFEIFDIKQNSLSNEKWFLLGPMTSKIKNKMEKNSTPLGTMCYIGQGMTTGLNDAFVIDDDCVKKYNLEKKFLRNTIKTTNIRKYTLVGKPMKFIFLTDETNSKEIPNILKHLSPFKQALEKRYSHKNKDKKWYSWSVLRNKEIFSLNQPKIILPLYAVSNRFYLDSNSKDESFITSTDTYIISAKKSSENLKFILGLLNSKLIEFYFKNSSKLKDLGKFEYSSHSLEKIPIRNNDKTQIKSQITDRVSKLTSLRKNFSDLESEEKISSVLQSEIDDLVYGLYGITEEERKIIESSV